MTTTRHSPEGPMRTGDTARPLAGPGAPPLPPGFASCRSEFEGIPVHYLEGGSGAPLLMLHGVGPGTSAFGNFQAVLAPLAQRFHVYAADLVGFGASGRKRNEPYFDFACWYRQAHYMLALIPEGPVGVVGHSLSGALALKLAAHEPRVRHVLTTSTVGTRFAVTPALDTIWTFPTSRDALRNVLAHLVFDTAHLTDEFLDDRLAVLRQPGYQSYFEAMFGGDRQRLVESWLLADDELAAIDCKVVMLHGQNDLPCPAEETTMRLAPRVEQADVILLAQCGHSPALEHPHKLMAAIELLLGAGAEQAKKS